MRPDEIIRIEVNQAICRTSNKYPVILEKEYYGHQARKAQMSSLGGAVVRNFEESIKQNGTDENDAKKLKDELE